MKLTRFWRGTAFILISSGVLHGLPRAGHIPDISLSVPNRLIPIYLPPVTTDISVDICLSVHICCHLLAHRHISVHTCCPVRWVDTLVVPLVALRPELLFDRLWVDSDKTD